MNEFDEVTVNQALRALVDASKPLAGVQVVRGTMADLPFPWDLSWALRFVRHPDPGIVAIVWDPDWPGLALIDRYGQPVYRFTTRNPFELPEPGPQQPAPGRAPALRIVRPAS
jgi:hypothetical protein